MLESVEDEIRRCEREGDFGPTFVELPRSVCKSNCHHAALTRKIHESLRSAIVEEKSHDNLGAMHSLSAEFGRSPRGQKWPPTRRPSE